MPSPDADEGCEVIDPELEELLFELEELAELDDFEDLELDELDEPELMLVADALLEALYELVLRGADRPLCPWSTKKSIKMRATTPTMIAMTTGIGTDDFFLEVSPSFPGSVLSRFGGSGGRVLSFESLAFGSAGAPQTEQKLSSSRN